MPEANAYQRPEENERFWSKHKEQGTGDEDVKSKSIITEVIAVRQGGY